MFHGPLFVLLGPIPVFGSPGTVLLVDPSTEPPEDEPPGADAAQIGPVMVLESNVIVPADCVKNRPFKVAPVFMALIPLSVKIFPMNEVVVSRVAELPILHHTLQGSPPVMDEPGDVIRDETVLKIQTPDPVRFKLPLSVKLLVEQYTPGPTPPGKVVVRSTAPKL